MFRIGGRTVFILMACGSGTDYFFPFWGEDVRDMHSLFLCFKQNKGVEQETASPRIPYHIQYIFNIYHMSIR